MCNHIKINFKLQINRTQLSVQLITLLTGLEEMLAGNVNSRGKLILDACDTAVRKSLELAKRIPRSKAAERVEKALQQVLYEFIYLYKYVKMY